MATDDRYALGAILSLAINAPKEFKRMVDRHRIDRAVERKGGSSEEGDDIIEMFRMHGIRVIDARRS